jgi:exocyst complex component 8
MQSLRTRKLQPNGQPQKLTKQPSSATRARANTRKSRIDDKIRKRMSTRYASISAPTDVSGVPDVPTVPLSLAAGRAELPQITRSLDDEYAQVRSDPRTVDINVLDQDNFNAESCQ